MTTGERIRARRKELRLPPRVMAAAANISLPTVYRYENGQIGKLPVSILLSFAKVLQTTPNDLLGWPIEGGGEPPHLRNKKFRRSEPAGLPLEEGQSAPQVPAEEIEYQCVGNDLSASRILDGDTVFIRRQSTVENGQMALVRLGEEQVLKRVYQGECYVELRSENPAVPPVVLRGEELSLSNYEVIGLAVAFQSAIR